MKLQTLHQIKRSLLFIPLLTLLGISFTTSANRMSSVSYDSPSYLSSSNAQTEDLDTTVVVNTVEGITEAIASQLLKGHITILLEDGIYEFERPLSIFTPSITIKGKSGVRENVIIQGDAMSSSAKVKGLIRVSGNDFHLADLTLRNCGTHLLQIAGEQDADRPIIDNVVFRDSYEQMLKITYSAQKPDVSSDSGIVRNCLFEYTAGVGPQYYIGGVDGHQTKDWVISGNVFKGITSPDAQIAEHAIHFWSDSKNTIVENNLIVNCQRGIGFGLTSSRGHIGGIIRNNIIYHDGIFRYDGTFAHDVAIGVEACPNIQIYNNTVYQKGTYPNSIELRYDISTNGKIYNNLCNRAIKLRDNSSADVSNNINNADSAWFVSTEDINFQLLPTAVNVIDAGLSVDTVKVDFVGNKRPWGVTYDIGAHEYNGINFYASSYQVKKGESVTLNWQTYNLENVTAYGAWSDSQEPSGSIVITPDSSSAYGIYGISGEDTARFIVSIDVVPEMVVTSIVPIKANRQELKVYPNPAVGAVFVELPEKGDINQQDMSLQLYSVTGQKIRVPYSYAGNKLIVNTSGIPEGKYVYLVSNKNEYIGSGKLIVRH
ncbi:T9SS type A sorting domain-containing protein [uncultured Sunxiuqinia sp.]|uniref:T9SS type A sorting domain-containing protein n=1 Tax=uncultured Sunxiuqinia sp. TaxID=1573825 RepID=UPI002AA6436B|nr:T9SS type A sorting domain-containing protein [uncultured Sunxiuqinia sp.]